MEVLHSGLGPRGKMCKCASNETAVLGWPGLACKCTVQHGVNRKTAVKHLKHCVLGGIADTWKYQKKTIPGKSNVTEAGPESRTPGRGRVRLKLRGQPGATRNWRRQGSTLPEALPGTEALGRPDCEFRASGPWGASGSDP